MSMNGSLVGYENNDDLCNKKNRSLLNVTASSKQCASLNSSITNSIIIAESNAINATKSSHNQNKNNDSMEAKAKRKNRFHLNTLWSIWYGLVFTYLQGYLILNGTYRFLGCYLIQWRSDLSALPELNTQIILCGFALLVLPLFFISTIFKVGNLANDGIKLASSSTGKCSAEPEHGLEHEAKGGTIRAIWTHGGPTSAFLHIIIALCLLIPRLLIESKLIQNGNLPRENIWHTELDFMVQHRDRLVILSFTTSPYQNNSIQDENYYKTYRRPTHNGDDDNEHLIEKVHSMSFDDNDYFDTHEKLENEKTTVIVTTLSPITSSMKESHESYKVFPTATYNQQPTEPIPTVDNPNISYANSNTGRKQNGKMRNRTNAASNAGRTNNRKNSASNRERVKEKSPRRGDDLRETGDFGNSKPSKKYNKLDTFDELQPDNEFEATTNRKVPNVRDSNIHIVKPADGTYVPSTPYSTDSKIIEIKPSSMRTGKRNKRAASEMIETRMRIETDADDEFGDISDDELREPRIYVNLDSDEHYSESEERTFKPTMMSDTYAAALIDATPVNVTTPSKQLNGFAGCLQHYFNVDKEIDLKNWAAILPSFEFLNFAVALIVWSARYPSVFWSTSKSFSIIFSIQMIANAVDILLVFAGVSVIYKLQIVGQKLPLQTPPLLLNGIVSLLLYILSILLTTSSSMILYLYGHGRLSSRVRDRRMISTKTGDTWAYFAHCASLCFILALAVVKAPLMHDFSAIYKGSLDGAVLIAALSSVMHIFFWIVLWLGLTAKRQWNFKLPPLANQLGQMDGAKQPLLVSSRLSRNHSHNGGSQSPHLNESGGDETIYWPKLAPNSPKLKVTFNDVPSTLSDNNLADEQDGKRNSSCRASVCLSGTSREIDEGEYATLRAETNSSLMHFNFISNRLSLNHLDTADDTSEEGKLLDCVRDDSVTYASTRDLEPPMPPPPPPPPLDDDCSIYRESSTETLVNPISVTVHTSDLNMCNQPMMTRQILHGDSGMLHDVLTPCTESTSTECSTSPPEAASDTSSSGIHSGEERDEVVIRQSKSYTNTTQPSIQEEPFGRSTNMRMSSFNIDTCATLPTQRVHSLEPHYDYAIHCGTMPLPITNQNEQYRTQSFITPNPSKMHLHAQAHHTTLPNGVRYANPSSYIRRVPMHVQTAESPYGLLGLGAGHHTFSKLLQDPLNFNNIPEDRDSANYSMISDQDRDIYVNALGAANIH